MMITWKTSTSLYTLKSKTRDQMVSGEELHVHVYWEESELLQRAFEERNSGSNMDRYGR